MWKLFYSSAIFLLGAAWSFPYCQNAPFSQREACSKFTDSVVRIDAGGQSGGTGFLVSPDGYILTANHVVRAIDGSFYSAISVKLSDGSTEFATVVSPLSPENFERDYALLKINSKRKLAFLRLGAVSDTVIGGEGTLIGYPLSAISREGTSVSTVFCLAVEFAGRDIEPFKFDAMQKQPNGIAIQIEKTVQVDVIYFQGPSIHGLSGSPIISRDNGMVVGILSTKLAAISASLDSERRIIESMGTPYMALTETDIKGKVTKAVSLPQTITDLIDTLDRHLANGLGSAVGIDDPKRDLEETQRRSAKQK